jgi:hypothetical protein
MLRACAYLGFVLLVMAPAAASANACWKQLVNDAYDGGIDGKYNL